MIEMQEAKSQDWEQVTRESMATCSGYRPSVFFTHRIRINGKVYRRPGPEFNEAFKKEQAWAKLQHD